MIPVSKATVKVVNRFPELYKRQALQAIDMESSRSIRITADAFLMAAMVVLIEDFDFGTTSTSTKLARFVQSMQKKIDTSSEFYEIAVVEGLRNQLQAYGVEYRSGGAEI